MKFIKHLCHRLSVPPMTKQHLCISLVAAFRLYSQSPRESQKIYKLSSAGLCIWMPDLSELYRKSKYTKNILIYSLSTVFERFTFFQQRLEEIMHNKLVPHLLVSANTRRPTVFCFAKTTQLWSNHFFLQYAITNMKMHKWMCFLCF